MITYYVEKEGKIVGFDNNKEVFETTIKNSEYKDLPILETERPIVDFQFADTPEYEAEQLELERERISHLKVTKRVFALALQQYGFTYTHLKELIATNEQAQLEWDLCVELERNNPLLDVMALQMGVTSAQLDYIFQKANGEDVEPPVEEEDTPAEEQDSEAVEGVEEPTPDIKNVELPES